MPALKQVKIGKHTFNAEVLRGLTQKEAVKRFGAIHPEIVKRAHKMAKGKTAKK